MELIPRYELQLECREVGRNLIDTVQDLGHDITDEHIDVIFEPLITSVETRTRDAVQHELDELRGQLDDQRDCVAVDTIVEERRADISESMNLYVNDVPCNIWSHYLPKGFQLHSTPIKYKLDESTLDLDDVSEDELLSHDSKDPYWNEYKNTCHVTISDPILAQLYLMNGSCQSAKAMLEYFKEHELTNQQVLTYTNALRDSGVYIGTNLCIIEQVLSMIHDKECQMTIRAGLRRGRLCGRKIRRNGKCTYHNKH